MTDTMFRLHSDHIDQICTALAKAQQSFGVARKDKDNPFTKSKYASYESMRKVCQDTLSENGLSICHQLSVVEGKRAMVTNLLHTSGQWLRSILNLSTKDESPQSVGSAITYAMRYSLAAMLAIPCGDREDDDGEQAQAPYREPRQYDPMLDTLTDEEVKEIENLIGKDKDLQNKILKGYAKSHLSDLLRKDFHSIVAALKKRKQNGGENYVQSA